MVPHAQMSVQEGYVMRWTWSGVEYEWTMENGIRWDTQEGFEMSWTLTEGIRCEMAMEEEEGEGSIDASWTLTDGVQVRVEGIQDDISVFCEGSWRKSDGIRVTGRVNDYTEKIHVKNWMILAVLVSKLWFLLAMVCIFVTTLLAGILVLVSVFAEAEHWWYHGVTVFVVLSALYSWWIFFLHDEATEQEGARHPRWYGRLLLSWPVVMLQVVMSTLVYQLVEYMLEDAEFAPFSLYWFGVLVGLVVLNTPVISACCARIAIAVVRVMERPVIRKFKALSEALESLMQVDE